MKILESGITLLPLLAMFVLLPVGTTVHADEFQEIGLLLEKGQDLYQRERYDDAIAVFDAIDKRFGTSKDAKIRERVASALGFKSGALWNKGGKMTTWEKVDSARKAALAVLDEMVNRYGDDEDPAVRAVVARALFEKGSILSQIGQTQAAIAARDELDRRFGQDEKPVVRLMVIRELMDKADRLIDESTAGGWTEDKFAPALAIMAEIVRRFGTDRNTEVQEEVIEVLFRKALLLRAQEEKTLVTKIVAIYDEIDQIYGREEAAAIRMQVAMALRTKGLFLAQQKQPQAALVALEEVDKRYAGDKPPVMREQVAYALIEKGKVFLEQNQHRQALAAFDLVIERYKGEYGMSRAVDLAEFYRYGER